MMKLNNISELAITLARLDAAELAVTRRAPGEEIRKIGIIRQAIGEDRARVVGLLNQATGS